jgi:4-diphosphocytidyl-2-C-methyl-D-erythritol kinase
MHAVKAYAKVNLGLAVVAKRGDGYHEVDTLMTRIDLCDEVGLEPTLSGVELEVRGKGVPTGATNLAYQAARRYLEAAGESGGVHLVLEKRIPVAAGLGGGSSDAAAVLRALADLYPSEVALLGLAKTLGADVPFFVRDVPAARARGRGEKLTPVTLPALHLLLANPGLEVSTQEAYAALQTFSPRPNLDKLLTRLAEGAEPGYLNALQPGVLALKPEVREVLAALRELGLRGVLMSGSGATCFGLARSGADATGLADELQRAHPGWWVEAVSTL